MSNVVRHMDNPRNWIIFNGKDLRDFSVYCNGTDTYNAPEHEYETITIPGRNGEFKRDMKRFQQIVVPYNCWIATNFDTNIKDLREYMLSVDGYAVLKDTYHPNTYRKAIFEGPIEVSPAMGLSFGSFTLSFNCKPERWLLSGDTAVTISSTGTTLTNETKYIARPTLKLIGHGTITVTNGSWSYNITVAANDYENTEYTIDTERLIAISSSGANMNQYVTPTDRDNWALLKPGNNIVNYTGFTSVKIIPRWWTI